MVGAPGILIRSMALSKDTAAYLRNFIFGVEDSIVSTVGLLSGVAIAGLGREEIFFAGVILIFVEAISMSTGSFLSESSAEEYMTRSGRASGRAYVSALIMFVSYFLSGFIPLAPYLLLPLEVAFWASIGVSLVALFALGVISGSVTRTRILAGGIRMLVIGGIAIAVGTLIGTLVERHF